MKIDNGYKKTINKFTDEKMKHIIEPDKYIVKKGDIRLNEIVGQNKAVEELMFLVRSMRHSEISKLWKSATPKGILLVGPPGTGKTASVRAVANEIGNDTIIMELCYRDIASKWVDASIEALNQFFNAVESKSKDKHVIIFLDEVDGLLPTRDENSHHGYLKIVTGFLEWLDGGFASAKNITIIAASNNVNGIDKAILRPGRIDKIIEYSLLTNSDIIHCLKIHLSKLALSKKQMAEIDWAQVLDSFDEVQLSGADVSEICQRIVREKVSEHISLLESSNSKTTKVFPQPICTKDLINHMQAFRTVSDVCKSSAYTSIGF